LLAPAGDRRRSAAAASLLGDANEYDRCVCEELP
jgi:hypothetical protein